MIHTQDADFTLYLGDVMAELANLPDESVHCVVTSPPYWGLRDYSTDGQIGLEPTPEQYVARMVEVFREVRRVLRADGTCWVNLGDSYAAGGGFAPDAPSNQARLRGESVGALHGASAENYMARATGPKKAPPGLKPKDLCGIPWRVAFALQADGWYLRSDIIWAKPNPMPESVTDRPTKSHEYVFMLTKSSRYFFDQEAVREGGTGRSAGNNGHVKGAGVGDPYFRTREGFINVADKEWHTRNVRTVWDIATQPYPEAHFATYPEELVRRCVLAGSSERGCCPVCGKPWERKTETSYDAEGRTTNGPRSTANRHESSGRDVRMVKSVETLGWRPGCDCGRGNFAGVDRDGEPLAVPSNWYDDPLAPQPIPCTVLDPFLGSGTTAYVARKHGRRSIGIELNPAYADLAAKRMAQQSLEFAL